MRFIFLMVLLLNGTAVAAQEEMTFALRGNGGNCAQCEWIEATGQITGDTPEVFRQFLAESGSGAQVVFHSPGGDLSAGVRLGRVIREAGLRTAIGQTVPDEYGGITLGPGSCESACAFAFMGGTSRTVADRPDQIAARSGRIGMHQFFRRAGGELPSSAAQQIMGQLLLFVLDMGVDPEVLALASATPANSMYYFSDDEVMRFGLQTSGGASATELVPEGDGLGVAWTMIDNTGKETNRAVLYCSARHRGWMLKVVQLGATSDEVGFDPAQPNSVQLQLGEDTFPFRAREIVGLAVEPEGLALRVRIRADLERFPGASLFFHTTEVRAFRGHLSVSGTVPDAATLSVMQRACAS